MDDIIVIDSDDDDLDRKPAAKKSGDDTAASKRSTKNVGVECISLVDDEDKKISANDIAILESKNTSTDDEFISLLDSGEGKKKSAMATNSDDPCVSLLDSSDEENFDNSGSYGMLSPKSRKRRRAEEADRKLAQQLQAQEDKAGTKANSRKEKKAMAKSTDGKSVLAVQQIIALVKTAKDKYIDNNVGLHQHIHSNNMNPAYMRGAAASAAAIGGSSSQETIEAVTIDDMVFFCKNMLEKQTEMIENSVSGFIGVLCSFLLAISVAYITLTRLSSSTLFCLLRYRISLY